MTDILDSQGMFAATAGLAEQVRAAADALQGGVEGLPEADDIRQVLVIGMGGSGIAGDVLAAVAGPFVPVPIVVSKDYELPGFVDESTLVFALSFSGNSEETVEAATEAAALGSHVVAVCQGGELAKRAVQWDMPVIGMPAGIPQPRAAIGALSVPLLLVLEQLGFFPGASQWIDRAVEQLARRRDSLGPGGGEAAALARKIGRTIPLVYGTGPIGTVAAARWKADVNENAKAPCFANRYPELCHNEIAGWGQHGDVTRQVFTIVNLRHDQEHPQMARRVELVNSLVEEVVAGVVEVRAEGEGPLAQLLDLALFGGLTSLWMAAHEGIDPGPVDVLGFLKAALAAP